MDLGSGIALAGVCMSGGAVAITAIKMLPKSSRNGALCKEHSGIKTGLKSIQDGLDRHEKWLSVISDDIKRLLSRGVIT